MVIKWEYGVFFMSNDYHPFKKTITSKNGKATKKWYYWYYDTFGNQVTKVCPNCKTQADAFFYCSQLPPMSANNQTTISEICRDMFIPNSDHMKRREQFGKTIKDNTLFVKRSYINLINEVFGNRKIFELTVPDIERYLLNDKHSASWKNNLLDVFNEVYEWAIWKGVKIQKPEFNKFKRNSKRQSVLSTEELSTFLQRENFPSEMFFIFFIVCVSAGMRLGEIRGMRKCQFLKDDKAILIDGFLDRNGNRNNFCKTGSEENPRYRVTLIPDSTVQILNYWIEKNNLVENDYVFLYDEKPIRTEYAEIIFRRALKNAEIDTTERKITPHALRYTFVTRTRRLVGAKVAQDFAGHTSERMTDHYTVFELNETVKQIAPLQTKVNAFFE